MRWRRGELDTAGLGMARARTLLVSGSRPVRLCDSGSACAYPETLTAIPGSPCAHPRIQGSPCVHLRIQGSGPVHLKPFLGPKRPRREPYLSRVRLASICTSGVRTLSIWGRFQPPNGQGANPTYPGFVSCPSTRIPGSHPGHLRAVFATQMARARTPFIPGSPCVHPRIQGSGPVRLGTFSASKRPRGEPYSFQVRISAVYIHPGFESRPSVQAKHNDGRFQSHLDGHSSPQAPVSLRPGPRPRYTAKPYHSFFLWNDLSFLYFPIARKRGILLPTRRRPKPQPRKDSS